MEEKKKLHPSLPANYVSILDLKERWMKEKERKRKEEEEEKRRKEEEEEERRRKQEEIEEELRIKEEEDLKKREEQRKRRKSKKKESGDGGEVRDVKSVGIVSERDEVPRDDDGLVKKKKKRNKGKSRKRYDSRKKRNHDAVAENVVDEFGGSIATEIKSTPVRDGALPVNVAREDKTQLIRVYREKGREEAQGNGPNVMAIGTHVVPRDEKKKETRNHRKKKNQDVVAVEGNVIESGTENKAPVKDVVQVYREKAKGNGPRDKAATDIETGFEDEKKKNKKKMSKHRKKKNQDVVAAVARNFAECGTENKPPVNDVVRVYREKAKGNGPLEKAVTDDVPDIETGFEDEKKKISKHRKKRNQDVVAMEEKVVEHGTENKTPVEGGTRVYREKAKGNGEKAVTDAMETQFENLSVEKEETKVLKEQTRSRKSRKKKIQNVVAVEDNVVERESIVKEKKTPVEGVIQVYREKVRKANGNGSCEEAVTAIETQFENLSVETKDLKAETRLSNRKPPNQRRFMRSQRVAAPMVWVKKGQNEGDGDGIGSGVKTFNA